MDGILVIDKPAGVTSHDVVNRVRRILGQKSVGHLGTLDPMATGVLPLLLGNLTRLAQFYTDSEKGYEGIIRFGFATDTYDASGEATTPPESIAISRQGMEALAEGFRGTIWQVPPAFSAKKIRGQPAYKLARKKQPVRLEPVQVEIKDLTIHAIDADRVGFRALVASGTYLRSWAHDMGQRLGCGAHLQALRRTRVGEFDLEQACTFEELIAASTRGEVDEVLIHPRRLLPQFPAVTANSHMIAKIRSGRAVNLPELSTARRIKVFSGQRELIAIATRVAGTLFHAKIVLLGRESEDNKQPKSSAVQG